MESSSRVKFPEQSENLPVWFVFGFWVLTLALLCFIFRQAAHYLQDNVSRANSYYSHSYLIPPVSLFFIWRDRKELVQLPRTPTLWGTPLLVIASSMVLASDLLGFRIFSQAAIIPLLAGFALLFLGPRHLARMWFPLVFLVFMIPMPESLTTGITFHVKMFAARGAVWLCNLVYLPVVQDGSFIHFGNEKLLIGDVCGGVRSLIALLALGAVMSYISETKAWSKILIFLVSAPVAIAANMFRIFFLCVVGNFWGSAVAGGWVHDVSGILIYVVALALLIGLEGVLRKTAPANPADLKEKP